MARCDDADVGPAPSARREGLGARSASRSRALPKIRASSVPSASGRTVGPGEGSGLGGRSQIPEAEICLTHPPRQDARAGLARRGGDDEQPIVVAGSVSAHRRCSGPAEVGPGAVGRIDSGDRRRLRRAPKIEIVMWFMRGVWIIYDTPMTHQTNRRRSHSCHTLNRRWQETHQLPMTLSTYTRYSGQR